MLLFITSFSPVLFEHWCFISEMHSKWIW